MNAKKSANKNLLNLASLVNIEYPNPFNVRWEHDPNSNTYKRFRGNQAEIDKNTNSQVSASVVVVMETTSTFTNKDYLSVVTTGQGNAVVYQNGIQINGKWSKNPSTLDSKLFFYDNDGEEIEFVPGKIWVEIITN